MTSRRRFLGAAALGLLPAPVDEVEAEISQSDWGCSRAQIEPGAPVYGSVRLPEFQEPESTIRVTGYRYDDDRGEVEIVGDVNGVHMSFGCSPDRARELASELVVAAGHADGGPTE